VRRVIIATVLLGLSLPAIAAQKTFEATYVATISNVPAGSKELKLWIPLPTTRGWQKISELQIASPFVWVRKTDPEFGNDYAFTTIKNPPAGDLTVRVRFMAVREDANSVKPADTDLKRAMRTDRLVKKITPDIRKLAEDLTSGMKQPMDQARAIFDHVAATTKDGDCADSQSLFLTLARAKGLPARFVSGFSTKGHECWAEFYVNRKGWIPVTSSAFGTLDADRVEFTVGRDVRLDPAPSESIEYFIYPYAEADGKPVGPRAGSLELRGQ
jgi:transglutaminase-like putative cysteine protease